MPVWQQCPVERIASLARALRVIRVCVELRSTVITKTTPPYRPVRFLLSCLRASPFFFFRCCCCCRCGGRCCLGCCACVSTRAAFAPARLQLSSRPARESVPVGLSTRSCPSLLLPSVRARAILPGLASAASTLRLRLCPAHLSRCCCWCRCSGRCFSGCVCVGAWVAFTSARLQFTSRQS